MDHFDNRSFFRVLMLVGLLIVGLVGGSVLPDLGEGRSGRYDIRPATPSVAQTSLVVPNHGLRVIASVQESARPWRKWDAFTATLRYEMLFLMNNWSVQINSRISIPPVFSILTKLMLLQILML